MTEYFYYKKCLLANFYFYFYSSHLQSIFGRSARYTGIIIGVALGVNIVQEVIDEQQK